MSCKEILIKYRVYLFKACCKTSFQTPIRSSFLSLELASHDTVVQSLVFFFLIATRSSISYILLLYYVIFLILPWAISLCQKHPPPSSSTSPLQRSITLADSTKCQPHTAEVHIRNEVSLLCFSKHCKFKTDIRMKILSLQFRLYGRPNDS